MARPDPQETADSTWQSPPIRRWRIRFFVSLCLFGFMTGLMLGALLKEKPNRPARLLDVQALDAGVRLCFSRLPKAAVLEETGAFVMLFAAEPADAQQGVLSLPSGGLASWHLSERSDGMQLGFVSLQPLRGSWSKDPDNSSCIRVDIFMAP